MASQNLDLEFLRESSICHVCETIFLDKGVFCKICLTWLHINCIKMTKKQYKKVSDSPLPYYCQQCISNILPLTSITMNILNTQTFNSNKTQLNNTICSYCDLPIINQRHIQCKIGKHTLHLKCANITNPKDINFKLN